MPEKDPIVEWLYLSTGDATTDAARVLCRCGKVFELTATMLTDTREHVIKKHGGQEPMTLHLVYSRAGAHWVPPKLDD